MATKKSVSRDIRENKRFGVQFAYLLDLIQSEDKELTTDKEKVEYFFSCFDKEHNDEFYRRAIPNEQKRIADYLQGLPSCCSVDYWNNDIIAIGKSWGFCQDDTKSMQFVNNWFNVLAFRLIQLREKFLR